MATLEVNADLPKISTDQSLTGWRREFCVELLGAGAARIYLRAVEQSSFKASELQRAILFVHVDSRFRDLEGCVRSMRADLERLAESAVRSEPDKENLYRVVDYECAAWDRVLLGIQRWLRR